MPEPGDWTAATWAENRLRQHREFLALPLREKLAVLEQLGEVAEFFATRRRARGLPVADLRAGEHGGGAASTGD